MDHFKQMATIDNPINTSKKDLEYSKNINNLFSFAKDTLEQISKVDEKLSEDLSTKLKHIKTLDSSLEDLKKTIAKVASKFLDLAKDKANAQDITAKSVELKEKLDEYYALGEKLSKGFDTFFKDGLKVVNMDDKNIQQYWQEAPNSPLEFGNGMSLFYAQAGFMEFSSKLEFASFSLSDPTKITYGIKTSHFSIDVSLLDMLSKSSLYQDTQNSTEQKISVEKLLANQSL